MPSPPPALFCSNVDRGPLAPPPHLDVHTLSRASISGMPRRGRHSISPSSRPRDRQLLSKISTRPLPSWGEGGARRGATASPRWLLRHDLQDFPDAGRGAEVGDVKRAV